MDRKPKRKPRHGPPTRGRTIATTNTTNDTAAVATTATANPLRVVFTKDISVLQNKQNEKKYWCGDLPMDTDGNYRDALDTRKCGCSRGKTKNDKKKKQSAPCLGDSPVHPKEATYLFAYLPSTITHRKDAYPSWSRKPIRAPRVRVIEGPTVTRWVARVEG